MESLKAKDCSLIAKIVAAIIAVVASVLKWVGVLPATVTEWDIAKCAFTVEGIFLTVDVNLIMEKIRDKPVPSTGVTTGVTSL